SSVSDDIAASAVAGDPDAEASVSVEGEGVDSVQCGNGQITIAKASLICLQLISTVTSDSNDASRSSQPNTLIQPSTVIDNEDITNYDKEDDEDYFVVPRAAEFLRFGRQFPSTYSSFLRFGRSQPTFLRFGRPDPNGAAFLRFGRQAPSSASSNFLRFGRQFQQAASNNFLRFGREAQPAASSNFLRFGRKGEFLRFG
ncbi:unnamed protein product, partial [Adineta ricciae]